MNESQYDGLVQIVQDIVDRTMKEKQNFDFGSKENAGPHLVKTRNECTAEVEFNTEVEKRAKVTGCILNKFTELDKAKFSSRQYILTLWPAFVGAIVALAPDPSGMVYDNIWWSGLFAITSGGLPGMESALPPHHVEAHSEREGRNKCEAWHFDPSKPNAMSKEDTRESDTRRMGYIRFEWASFFTSFALWLAFCLWFGQTIRVPLDITFEHHWLMGATWYYISAAPALLGLVLELMRNRVDLYEPANTSKKETEESSKRGEVRLTISEVEQPRWNHIKVKSVFSLWLRILLHQWRGSQYRILVRDHQSPRWEWLFVLGRALVGMSRIAVFTLGSITMGNIILMPVPDDVDLFMLLLVTTALPRQLWSAFWANGNRGADLVVRVRAVKMMRPDGDD